MCIYIHICIHIHLHIFPVAILWLNTCCPKCQHCSAIMSSSWEGWQDWPMSVDTDADQGAAEITVGMANLQRDWVYTPMPILVDTVETVKGKGKGKEKGKKKGKEKGKTKGKEKGKTLALIPAGGKSGAHDKKVDREHMLRKCKQCYKLCEWRRMEGTRVVTCEDKDTELRMGFSVEKNDVHTWKQYRHYTYLCVECVASRCDTSPVSYTPLTLPTNT